MTQTFEFVIPLAPVTASRPRVFRNGGRSYGKNYMKWLEEAPAFIPDIHVEGLVEVVLECVCKPLKTKTARAPMGDVDNYSKGPLDLLTKAGVWGDDREVMRLVVSKRYAEKGEAPHTKIIIKEM